MMKWPGRELCDSIRPERVTAIMEFGFNELQARFLLNVLVFSGVFIERQFRAFTGVKHGVKTAEFLTNLVGRGYATAIMPGKLHRGRLFHVQYKPLYEAIGEANNRNRKPASTGRFVERLMMLDAVLSDPRHWWLGTERDKVTYFDQACGFENPRLFYPKLTFGQGREKITRYFPDKLPIGIAKQGRRHVFLYLVTRRVPFDFRIFLARHAELLMGTDEWTLRVLVPRRFWSAVALHRFAVRDTYIKRLTPHEIAEFDWYCRARRGQTTEPAPTWGMDVANAARKFDSARFRALERVWEHEGEWALRTMQSDCILEQFRLKRAALRFIQIPHQYLQLTPLIGAA